MKNDGILYDIETREITSLLDGENTSGGNKLLFIEIIHDGAIDEVLREFNPDMTFHDVAALILNKCASHRVPNKPNLTLVK